MDRIMIAGTHSGCGKTTVTCALLKALKNRGLEPSAFKCGPDYLDPMFHRRVVGVPSRNLDPFFSSPAQLRQALGAHGGGISVLEGVMGYYDGVGPDGRYSPWEVAQGTATPVVLVVDVKGMYASAGALLKGFAHHRAPSGIGGVIFNNASPPLYQGLCEVARQAGVKPLGFLPREEDLAIGSRHLGLITADEIAGLDKKLTRLGQLAQAHFDLEGLLRLAASAPALQAPSVHPVQPLASVSIAVARDKAFCFLYEENLELLQALGCRLHYFSPLQDTALPPKVAGLYLCGGYPELHLEALSGNTALLREIAGAIRGGLPTIAECGGFLYLHDTLDGIPMAGVIPAAAYRTNRLTRFGYITLRAQEDNLLCAPGESIPAHGFHYYDSTDPGAAFVAEKPLSPKRWPSVHATESLYAGFPHLYFPANPAFARRFVKKAADYDRIFNNGGA